MPQRSDFQPKFTFDPLTYRGALMALPQTAAWEQLDSPQRSEIYVPDMHSKALAPDVSVVEGMRGAGKSFWTAVLADQAAREYVSGSAKIHTLHNVIVRVGFGLDNSNELFPTAKRMTAWMDQGISPDEIWRSVLIRQGAKAVDMALPFTDSVDAAAQWVSQNPHAADDQITEIDRQLVVNGQALMLLFDSLERLADDWAGIRERLKAALVLCLECRTRRAIRFKFFLRPDMIEEEDELWHFADSSKLLHSKATLAWRPDDFYGLIALFLANHASLDGEFREELTSQTHLRWQAIDGIYALPRRMPFRDLIEALAGPFVGPKANRGNTYTWIPTHLSDAKARLSPRSILLALRHAAEWTETHHPEHRFALHYDGVRQGVAEASTTRIREIKEDYPWVGPLLESLKGTTVPLKFDDLTSNWIPGLVDASLSAARSGQRLPPRRYDSDPIRKGSLEALVADLIELAVLYPTEDGRFNMPDIFRVGFGIKRRGGGRPPR